MPRKSGFTLIELLVVISIIALLSVVGLISYTAFLKNTRDVKRQSDLKIIQSALENYHADQIYYPNSLTFGGSLTSGIKIYLNEIPNDPNFGSSYSYVPSPSGCSGSECTSYCLFANMENTPPNSDNGCTNFPSGYDYGVTRP